MIVDASVAVKWLAKEDDSDAANAVLGQPGLIAPDLILSEVANAIWRKQRQGEVGLVDVRPSALTKFIERLEPTAAFVDQALVLAKRMKHPIYDCIYLAMAEAEDLPLITADARFTAVCRANGFGSRLRVLEDGA